ncbi:MAG: aminoacetone oxidase family FAD-binding enzyme, partial [Lachnospiraceae bacterium]|nr:aminoacetone oxidase family FAD-binding enzyme [Lachnospiraceae bacterium]
MSGTIAIIGAGASGCMAAIAAARTNPGARVLLLDGNEEVGRKILVTGNGRCNYTNEYQSLEAYHSDDAAFVARAMEAFGKDETIALFREMGVIPYCKNGYYYPMSRQAVSIRHCLEKELARLGVEVLLSTRVIGIEATDAGYQIRCMDKELTADCVILSTGGKAAPDTGSDGSGYSFAKRLGHEVIPPVPALVPLACKQHPLTAAAGARVNATVSTMDAEGRGYYDIGEVQITKQGISGIPVFQISHVVAKNLAAKIPAEVIVDFWPTASVSEILSFVEERRALGNVSALDVFNGIFPHPLIQALFDEDFRSMSDEELVKRIKEVPFEISQTMGFGAAQTSAGGVSLQQLADITMESSLHQGLFFAGEVLHVDGICGGYNLQWA